MGCNANILGITDTCASSVGGIKAAVFINAYETYLSIDDDGQWVLPASASAEGVLMPFIPSKQTSSFTSTLNVDTTNGSAYVNTEVILQYNRMDVASRVELNKVLAGRWFVFIKDANDKWYAFGENKGNYAYASAGTGQTGGERSDGNYYQVTITAAAAVLPVPCTDADTIKMLESAIIEKKSHEPATNSLVNKPLTAVNVDSDGISVISSSKQFPYLIGADTGAADNYDRLVVRASAKNESANWLKPGVVSYTYGIINGDDVAVTEKNADIAFAADYTDNTYVAAKVYGRNASGDWTLIAYTQSGGGAVYYTYSAGQWASTQGWKNGAFNSYGTLYAPYKGTDANSIKLNAYLG